MALEYYYLLMSQQDLLQNEVIEEIVRERVSSYALQNRRNDFWILISPNFIKSPNLKQKIKQTKFYQQKNIQLVSNNNLDYYGAIVSVNKEFLTWLSLRLGYFENIENISVLTSINSKMNYVSNGIFGKIDQTELKLAENSPLKSYPKNLNIDFTINKYKKVVELSQNFISQ